MNTASKDGGQMGVLDLSVQPISSISLFDQLPDMDDGDFISHQTRNSKRRASTTSPIEAGTPEQRRRMENQGIFVVYLKGTYRNITYVQPGKF